MTYTGNPSILDLPLASKIPTESGIFSEESVGLGQKNSKFEQGQEGGPLTNSEILFTLVSERVETIFRSENPDGTVFAENILGQEAKERNIDTPVTSESRFEILANARRDVQLLLAELKYKAGRTEIILGTKQEQAAFLDKIEKCLTNPGIYSQSDVLRSTFETIITDELANGISRAKRFTDIFQVDYLRNDSKDARFNFPVIDKNSTLIPMDIHLAFEPKNTVQEAKERVQKQYRGKFNAIILIDSNRVPLGIISTDELSKHDDSTLLGDVLVKSSGPFGTLETPSNEIGQTMEDLGVNIFPIVDTNTRVLIGYITHETVTIQETRIYLPRLQAQIGETSLRNEIQQENNT